MKIAGGIEHGKLDENGRTETKGLAKLRVKQLALAQGSIWQEKILCFVHGDRSTLLLLHNKGTVGLHHLGSARTTKDDSTLALFQADLGLLITLQQDVSSTPVYGLHEEG